MELQGDRLIPAPPDKTWAALNDPDTLKACIAGCESLERTGDDAFVALVAVKVGPVSARFKGNLKLSNVVAPTSYTINFDGQGGVAGFGKGSADVALAAEGAQHAVELPRARPGGRQDGAGRLTPGRCRGVEGGGRLLQGLRGAPESPEAGAPADTGQVPMPADTEKGNRALWWGVARPSCWA